MKTKPLRELCEDGTQNIVDGPFGSEMKRSDYVRTGYPVLKIQDVKPMEIRQKSVDFVSPAKFQYLKRHSFQRGDIVITKLGDPLGVAAIVEKLDEGIIVADLVRIRAQRVNTRYLCYHLNSPQTGEFINSLQKGTTRPRVTLSAVRDLPIYVPPLPEQQRIVGILDEAFAGIATAKANAEKNLRNAHALFASCLASSLTDSWPIGTLEDAVTDDCTLSYGIVQPGEDEEDGLHVVRPVDLTSRIIGLDGLKRIDPKRATAYKRTTLQGGELLLCVRGSTGAMAVASHDLKGANVTRGIVPIRFKPALLDPEFGYYLFRSEQVQGQIAAGTYGAALMQINIRDLRKLKLFLPSLPEQRKLVTTLSGADAQTQRLVSLCQQKLAALDALKKSFLHQAFSGQLSVTSKTTMMLR